jgi:16S rRNA C967 or C1407 C5-methylase (RsmB/RsmF family)
MAFSDLTAEFVLNEKSRDRFFRLKKVIQGYFGSQARRVEFVQRPGGLFGKTHLSEFDRVLVDAPCSGERFLLSSKQELALWKPSRSKRLAQDQYALATAAFLALRPGGVLVYSTCSISAWENDGVVERVLQRFEGQVQLEADLESMLDKKLWSLFDGIEKTSKGWLLMPDRLGFGPLYFSVIRKRLNDTAGT